MHFVQTGLRRLLTGCALATALATTPALAAPLKFTFTGVVNGTFMTNGVGIPSTYGAFAVGAYKLNFTNGTGDFSTFHEPYIYANYTTFGRSATTVVGDFLPNQASLFLLSNTVLPFTTTGGVSTVQQGTYSLGTVRVAGNFVSGTTTLTIAPGAPAPELGFGWLAGFAAVGALAATRLRRPLAA